MKKVKIVVGMFISVLLIGVAIIMVFKQPFISRTQENISSKPTDGIQEMATWDDPAGFSFQYPKELVVDNHDEDQENYAHIEFSSTNHQGKLFVWAKDTTYSNVQAWVSNDPIIKNGVSVDTKLGTEHAKKIIITSPVKKYITGAITDQILFTIEFEPIGDDPFWQKTYEGMVNSFVFTPLPGEPENNINTMENSAVSYDEEEVIE